MKRYVIIKPNCRELANHLWNYMSIYAYGLGTEVRVENPSFIEWHRYFNLAHQESLFTRVAVYIPPLHEAWKTLCILYGSYLVRFCRECVRLTLGITMYLPPTKPLLGTHGDACETTYFIGWHFRNPAGLERYREVLIAAFMPKEHMLRGIKDTLIPFAGKRLIGIYVRQTPYKGFPSGDFLIPAARVRRIVEEYLYEQKLDATDVALIIVSDKSVDPTAFDGLLTHRRCGNDVTSLFLLSKCSVVIGSNSTFSNLAAWFGNISHIVTSNERTDWEYYRERRAYFENKYATFAE